MSRIVLSDKEYQLACQIASQRFERDRQKNRQHTAGATNEMGTKWDVVGSCGELSFHKYLGIPITEVYVGDDIYRADVTHNGVEYEVRTITFAGGHLWVKETDPEYRMIVLIEQLSQKEYDIKGTISVLAARDIAEFKRLNPERPEQWWVSRKSLMRSPSYNPL